MTPFFQKKPSNEVSSEHATTQIEQMTMPSSTLMVSTSPVMTSMGLFPKMLNSTPQWQSTVTILSNYAIAGNDFKLHSSKESMLLFQSNVTPLDNYICLQKSYKSCKVALL